MNGTMYCYINLNNITKCMESSTGTGFFVLAISNSVLAVPTAAANALVIAAILTKSSLRTPSYLLLTSLAFSDLAVGILVLPFLSASLFGILQDQKMYLHLLFSFTLAAILTSCVSVLTLAAISVDRYLAIRLKMRYRSFVTIPRTRCLVALIWSSTVLMDCYLLIVRRFSLTFGVLAVVALITCLLLSVVCYTMSFRALKAHCALTQPQDNQQPNSTTQSNANAIDVLKYRKLLNTMTLVAGLVFICYLPLIGFF